MDDHDDLDDVLPDFEPLERWLRTAGADPRRAAGDRITAALAALDDLQERLYQLREVLIPVDALS